MLPGPLETDLRRAAEAIASADALVVGAGAGMGVDSGLPDFRGNEGFWKAYPPFRERGLSFVELANPVWFHRDPAQAWGFYGHRLQLYRDTAPHRGFARLLGWANSCRQGYFVFTSNVDGHFQRAGFDARRTVECHGSIHHLQCADPCSSAIWPADDLSMAIDERDFRAREPLPRCPHCGRMARPNVLMFGDGDWVGRRSDDQWQCYSNWLGELPSDCRLVTIECGAGTAVPTVRHHCERLPGLLVRINPREPQVPRGAIGLASNAAAALDRLAELIDS